MPELPEVEVVRRGLERWVTGRTVGEVEVLHPRAVRRHLAGGADFAARLGGARLGTAMRRGKYLWVPLDDAATSLLGHLGMSGQLLVQPEGALDEKHLRIRIRFDDSVGTELRFVDQRTFGGLSSTRTPPRGCPTPSPISPATHWTRPSTTPRSTSRCGCAVRRSSAPCSTSR